MVEILCAKFHYHSYPNQKLRVVKSTPRVCFFQKSPGLIGLITMLYIQFPGGNRCKDNPGACLFGKCRDVGNDFRCTQCETGYVLREDNKRCVGKSKESFL